MMTSIQFGGSYQVDGSFKQRLGEKAANQAEAALKKHFGPLEGEDVELTFRYKSPTDFDLYPRDILEGYSTKPNGEKTRHYFERFYGNVVGGAFAAGLSGLLAVGSLFSKDMVEARNLAWQNALFRTEPLDKFVARSLQAIKAKIAADKTPAA